MRSLPTTRLAKSSTALNYDVVSMTPLFATQLAACTSIIGMGAYVESRGEQELEISACNVDLKLLGEGTCVITRRHILNTLIQMWY